MKGYKWKVEPRPTGRWKSFQTRAWPSLERDDGFTAAMLACKTPYDEKIAASGKHVFISVWINVPNDINVKLPLSYATLAEAKVAAEAEVLQRDKELKNGQYRS